MDLKIKIAFSCISKLTDKLKILAIELEWIRVLLEVREKDLIIKIASDSK